MSRLFQVVTNVWGDWHIDLFLNLTLPNLLSPRNLPALASRGRVVYRVFTTPPGRQRIEASDIARRLHALDLDVEYLTPLGTRAPDSSWHVHWFHRAAAEAKAAGAFVLFVAPDSLWTDGSFEQMAKHMLAGRRGVACPYLPVSSDTCVADARERFVDAASGVLTLPSSAVWPFAQRHLHPLHALAIPGGPHARPLYQLHWPVGSEGTISRYAFREFVAFDPSRCPITFLWNADGPEDLDGIYFAHDSDDMFMLSVDSIGQYFRDYIVNHSCHPFDVSRASLLPLNDTKQTRVFVSHNVEIHADRMRTDAWRRQDRRARAAARDIRVGRAAMLLSEMLMTLQCAQSSKLLNVALLDTHLSRRWRDDTPLTVIASTDTAFSEAEQGRLLSLIAPGNERALVEVLRDHLVPGELAPGAVARSLGGTQFRRQTSSGADTINGVNVLKGPIDIEGVHLFIVEGIVSEKLRAAIVSTI